MRSYKELKKIATNPTIAEVLDIDDEDLKQAFVTTKDNAVVVNIESNTFDIHEEEGVADKISDKVFDLKPRLLEKYPDKEYVEINVM